MNQSKEIRINIRPKSIKSSAKAQEESMEDTLARFSGKYYQMLRADYTSGDKYKPFLNSHELGVYTEAPFWDSDPSSTSPCGMLIAKGHPLFLSKYLLDEYSYDLDKSSNFFEVKTEPDPPLSVEHKPYIEESKVYRAQRVMKVREIDATQPEFDSALLLNMAKHHPDHYISSSAIVMLEPKKQKEYWLYILESKSECDAAQAARQLIKAGYNNSEFLINVAKRFFGKEIELPQEAISKITDAEALMGILNKPDLKCVWGRGSNPSDYHSLHKWAVWRLSRLGRLDILAQLKNHPDEDVRSTVHRILSNIRY